MSTTVETADRVRSSSSQAINRQIDREIEARIRRFATRSKEDITHRIWELDREWDIERVLETNASVLAFTGLFLGSKYDRRWLMLPGIVLPFLFQHAIQGWCPPVPIFRRMGVRTRQEIEREKYALKILRGDFEKSHIGDRAEAALAAVKM
ncbi:MAG: hypothetical protein M8364_12215 [Methylobacter sp.]|uniref:hypothetical protein n=1 Tax=Methylobacter sp. TaxID=2051955 RepID=UPI0025860497|nr:hypothetical protein [Methylobacter sp.]MCL7421657.1 hypothetical protein [Methylobacter sp.]